MANDYLQSENEFQQQVIDLAHVLGYRVAHFRKGMTSRVTLRGKQAWVTPVQADGKGFPDLVLTKNRVIFAECKSEKGTLTKEQREWGDTILMAGGEWYCWRSSDWDEIVRILQGE